MHEDLPQPTIWPAGLAVGLVCAAFGMITVGIFFYVGVVLVFLAATGWVRDLVENPRAPIETFQEGYSPEPAAGTGGQP